MTGSEILIACAVVDKETGIQFMAAIMEVTVSTILRYFAISNRIVKLYGVHATKAATQKAL
jgi:hypothetical protein